MSTPALQNTAKFEVLRPVEADLLRDTNGVAVEWYGRAATALYRAYTIARDLAGAKNQTAEVILPSISCATPANAALLAGVLPRFADVDSATGMPTLEHIQARWTPETCAVVFIHLFGQTADLRPLAAWCRTKNILLIEDLAQALGAKLPNGPAAGSVGDLSVFSFNATKILECEGGALLIRDPRLAAVSERLAEIDPLPDAIHDDTARILALSYRNLHHSLVVLSRARAVDDISEAFLKLQPAFQQLYVRHMERPATLADAWKKLPRVLAHRTRNAQRYEDSLKDGPWRLLDGWRHSGVCWRYSLLVDFPEQLVAFSEAVRGDGFHVSNLYWPVNEFFHPEDRCPKAEQFARSIVNLWVDQTVDTDWVKRCTKSLHRQAERYIS